jgi:hypothetical protein
MAKVGLLDEHGVWDPGAYDASPMPTAKPAQPAQPSQGMTAPHWPYGDWSQYPQTPGGAPGQVNFTDPTNKPPAIPLTGHRTTAAPFDINTYGQDWIKSGGKTLQDWLNYVKAHPLGAGYSLSGTKQDKVVGPNGQGWDAVIASGMGGQGASWNPFGGGGSASGSPGGGIFTDPATAQWESALNGLASRLQQPQQNPDYQPYVDYLRKYFQQLQQPAYSPSEMDLLQTQALDPLTRQRDAARKQSTERLAARGISPSSGITEQSLRDIENRYGQLATQQRGAFATNAINQNRQQAQQAAGVGSALNQLETSRTATDESRALQALSLLFQVPQYADTRLGLANQTLMPTNPMSALSLYPSFANVGMQQNAYDQQFWSQLAQTLVHAFGG